MKKDTPEEFMKYLKCRLELFPEFVSVNPKYPADICNEVLFKEEFTYKNWLKGKMGIGKRLYRTGFDTITTKGPIMFGERVSVKDSKRIMAVSYTHLTLPTTSRV